jgi:hypothetical protein
MPIPMPPVINKGRKEVNDKSRCPIAAVFFQMKDRHVIEPTIPSLPGENGDSELNGVNEDDAAPPCVYARKLHGGPESFRDDAANSDPEDNENVHNVSFG